jgi:hypothetical protein
MRALLLLLHGLLLALPASAGWTVKTWTDSMTDRVKREASVANDAGHRLSVYRGPDGAAWVTFSLASPPLDTIAPRPALIYRIDKYAPHDLESDRVLTESKLGLRLYAWEPGFVNFVVWHGKEDQGRSRALNELMTGANLIVRFHLGTGGYRETSFPLDGASPAIAEALGIALLADPEREAAAKAFNDALLEANSACTAYAQQRRLDDLRVCRQKKSTPAGSGPTTMP